MKPTRIDIPEAQLDDLRRRIAATRWPEAYASPGWERGTPLGYLHELADHWQHRYDWRAAEHEINQYPQFTTDIDGAKVHFLHVTSPEPNARPLLLTHSWPGSIVEFLDMIGPLSNPRAHGADPTQAFHLVIPAIPGYGFSGPLHESGWTTRRVAGAWAELMRRLGYSSYLSAGGDWGSIISLDLARVDKEHVAGVHICWPTVPARDAVGLTGMSESELAELDQISMSWFNSELSAYLRLQTTRPWTLAYALSDSPVGQLSWIVEKFQEWNKAAKSPEDVIDQNRLLTNVSIQWFTNTAGSALQLYYESGMALGALFTPGAPSEPVEVPVGVAFFPQDPSPPFRAFGELERSTIQRWTAFEKGGHFGPMEQSGPFVADLRAFASDLRS
ncbi:epoxide hydrolase family protein [Salinispora pacifica]|nr:epoxide hydrolase family protein [Salinispora pacifica]